MKKNRITLFKMALLLCLLPFEAKANSDWSVKKTTIAEITGTPSHTSSEGRDMVVYSIKRKSSLKEGPKFFIQGGLHGNETQTSQFVLWLIKRIKEGKSPLNQLPEGSQIDFLPYANPDQYAKSRYNSNHINLNRNFSILWGKSREPAGSHPHSEKETKAIAALLKAGGYTAATDVHGYVNWIVGPSKAQFVKNTSLRKQRAYRKWMHALKRALPILDNYKIKDAGSLGDGGAFEDFAFWRLDTFAFCLEMKKKERVNAKGQDTYQSYETFIGKMFQEAFFLKEGASFRTTRNFYYQSRPSL